MITSDLELDIAEAVRRRLYAVLHAKRILHFANEV